MFIYIILTSLFFQLGLWSKETTCDFNQTIIEAGSEIDKIDPNALTSYANINLKNLQDEYRQKGIEISGVQRVYDPDDSLPNSIVIKGKLAGEEGDDYTLARLDYSLDGNAFYLEVKVSKPARGNGLQNLLYNLMVKDNVQIKRWETSLVDVNKQVFLQEMVSSLGGHWDEKGASSIDKYFKECCQKKFEELAPEQKLSILKQAAVKTPNYKGAAKQGFKDFCSDPAIDAKGSQIKISWGLCH